MVFSLIFLFEKLDSLVKYKGTFWQLILVAVSELWSNFHFIFLIGVSLSCSFFYFVISSNNELTAFKALGYQKRVLQIFVLIFFLILSFMFFFALDATQIRASVFGTELWKKFKGEQLIYKDVTFFRQNWFFFAKEFNPNTGKFKGVYAFMVKEQKPKLVLRAQKALLRRESNTIIIMPSRLRVIEFKENNVELNSVGFSGKNFYWELPFAFDEILYLKGEEFLFSIKKIAREVEFRKFENQSFELLESKIYQKLGIFILGPVLSVSIIHLFLNWLNKANIILYLILGLVSPILFVVFTVFFSIFFTILGLNLKMAFLGLFIVTLFLPILYSKA